MAFSGTFLTIDGLAVGKLATYKVEYNKLWKDADRNMNGSVRASLIGIFNKIVVETGDWQRIGDIRPIIAKLNSKAYFSCSYYDFETNTIKSGSFYVNDFNIEYKERERELVGKLAFNLIPVDKN